MWPFLLTTVISCLILWSFEFDSGMLHFFLNGQCWFFSHTALWSHDTFLTPVPAHPFNLHVGDNFLNLASVLHFIKADWIGIGKQYPTKNPPHEVHWAKQELLRIPVTEEAHFPLPNVSITQFLCITLSPQSAEKIVTQPQTWFSSDLPRTDRQHHTFKQISLHCSDLTCSFAFSRVHQKLLLVVLNLAKKILTISRACLHMRTSLKKQCDCSISVDKVTAEFLKMKKLEILLMVQ